MIKVMILAAGLGTRLRPLTNDCPKPLIPLMLQPLLGHVLSDLRSQGVREVILNLHYHATQMAHWLGDGSRWGLHVTVSVETEILGTAGALKRVAPLLQEAPFIVMNGDVLMPLDLHALWHWHCQRQAMVTMVVRPDPAARAYGPVLVDGSTQRVLQINGRPAHDQELQGEETVFTGTQVVSPSVLEHIPPERFFSTTAEVYPAIIKQYGSVYGYRYTDYWMDLGTPERYLQAHWDILDGQVGDHWGQRLPVGSTLVHATAPPLPGLADVIFHPPVVLGANVQVAAGTHLGPYAVLGSGCRLGEGVRVQESVLGDNVQVGAGAHLHRCALGADSRVQAHEVLSGTVRSRTV